MLNLDYIRSQFPGLDTDWVLFDNAGGSQILKPIVDKINEHFVSSNVQLGGSYPHSALATERHLEAHNILKTWINASSPQEIVMGSSTSLLIRTLANNYARIWKQGDEIIVTNLDHEANIGAWRELEEQGLIINEWKVNPETFNLEAEDLEKLLSDRTRMVAFSACSNVVGSINPIKEFTDLAHKAGALVCVDAVAYMPHRQIDVKDTDVDFFVFSFYKTYGPHYAMMYGKLELLEKLPGNNHFFINESPYKFQPGNYNFEFAWGISALPEYLIKLADKHGYIGDNNPKEKLRFIYAMIAEHEELLAIKVLDFLNSRKDIKIIGSKVANRELRVPTIAFIQKGTDSESITLKTDKHKVAIRWGDFYARRLIDSHGLDSNNGVVRISMVHYNSTEETDRLIEALDKSL